MKKDEMIVFNLDFYDRQEVHNIPTLVDNETKDGFVLKYDEDKSEIISGEIGSSLVAFLNFDISNKSELKKYLLSNYSLISLKGIYEAKTKRTFKNEYINKREYEEYESEVFEICYDEIIKVQEFFKDYLDKIYGHKELSKYEDIGTEMRELIFIKDKTTDLKLYNKFEKALQSNFAMGRFKTTKYNWHLIKKEKIDYIMGSDNIMNIFYVQLKYLIRYKSFNINKCEYCSDYFLPISRSDEKFCSKVYPDGTTCRNLGARDNWKTIMEQDEVRKLYTNTYQKKLMYCKRNPEDEQAKEDFEIWKVNVKTIMKLYKKGKLKKEDVIIYIKSGNLDSLYNKED